MVAKKKAVKKKIGSSRRGQRQKETAAEKTDVSTAAPSLLLGNMPPVKELLYHLEQIAGYQAKAKTASMAVTKAKNAAKAAGVDLKALSETQGLIGMDPLDMATFFRQLQTLMREKGTPIQIGLFEPKHGSIEEQGAFEGWRDGKAGRTPDTTRWVEGAPGYVEYMRRWNDSQKDNIENGLGGGDESED